MDPLSVQMTLGSPNMLRGKVSFSNLTNRKKKSPESNKSSISKTPKRLAKIDENLPATPSRSDTVRTRRGFRPLSVLTMGALAPFEIDAMKALDGLQDIEKGKSTDSTVSDSEEDKTPKIATEVSREAGPNSATALAALPFSNESELTLRTFLAHTPPTTTEVREIKAPFSTLSQLPPPEISQHPAFSSNPFTSRSDAPNLVTTSTAEEIRRAAAELRISLSRQEDRTSTGSDIFGSADRKRLTFFEKIQSPSSTTKLIPSNSTDSSPLSKRQPKSRPIEVDYSSLESPSSDTEKKRIASGGLRKISDIFKPRTSTGKQPLSPPAEPMDSPKNKSKELEIYLRRVTCSPTYEYTDNSWLPCHPNTGRFWRSRNLKCTTCLDVSCAVCRRACCAYKAAVMALENHKHNPEGRQTAISRIQQITSIFPYGREIPTFLQCTRDVGDTGGCGKLVCPDCCGICPDEACADVQCRRCKKDPWAECDWHSSLSGLGNAVNTRQAI